MRLQPLNAPGSGLNVAGKPATSGLISRIDSNRPHQDDRKWLGQTFLRRPARALGQTVRPVPCENERAADLSGASLCSAASSAIAFLTFTMAATSVLKQAVFAV